MDPLDIVFRHLDRWRHLPNYQLERRADIFFSVYLHDVVEELTGVPLEDDLVPELPIKRDLVWPELPTNKSVKVDYALFARDRSRVFFVELKTDGGSRRDAQDTYLDTARRLGFRKVLEGVRAILLATSAYQKYHHLACALARLGYLKLPPDLARHVYPAPAAGLLAQLERIEVGPDDPAIEIIYVQPEATEGDRCIDFARFAEHLLKWRAIAGGTEPAV